MIGFTLVSKRNGFKLFSVQFMGSREARAVPCLQGNHEQIQSSWRSYLEG